MKYPLGAPLGAPRYFRYFTPEIYLKKVRLVSYETAFETKKWKSDVPNLDVKIRMSMNITLSLNLWEGLIRTAGYICARSTMIYFTISSLNGFSGLSQQTSKQNVKILFIPKVSYISKKQQGGKKNE